jgi:predicted phage baseplate assembly protein
VHFPPAVREADGSLRGFGAVPPKGAPLRVPEYLTGGGPAGNVAARTITVLRTTVPFVDRVENRRAAHGGVDGETIEEAKERGPLALRTRDRAVTAEDYEQLARRAAPGIARVRCVPGRVAARGAGRPGPGRPRHRPGR